MLPAERSAAQVFKALFIAGDATSMQKQMEDLRTGRSILDAVADRTAALQKQLGGDDRARLDQYFTSVREVERRLLVAEEWEQKPKPKVDVPAPKDGEYLLEKLGAMFDLAQLATLLAKLKASTEGDATLLDRTQVLYGSNLGNGNNHDTHNLPVLLAGGGYKHGQHLAFDKANNYPLPNLFVTMLQRLGIDADKFASSTGTMRGLEMA